MEREMIHYLSFDLTITADVLEKFTQSVRVTYKRGVPKTPYQVVHDKSRENDYFGKGSLEIETRPLATTSSTKRQNILEATTHIPVIPVPISIQTSFSTATSPSDEDFSPNAVPSSSSSSSSRTSSPPSPYGPKTPPRRFYLWRSTATHQRCDQSQSSIRRSSPRRSRRDVKRSCWLGFELRFAQWMVVAGYDVFLLCAIEW